MVFAFFLFAFPYKFTFLELDIDCTRFKRIYGHIDSMQHALWISLVLTC